MEFGSTVLGAVVEKAMGLIIKVVTPKSRKIHIEAVEQLPESAPIVWVHPDDRGRFWQLLNSFDVDLSALGRNDLDYQSHCFLDDSPEHCGSKFHLCNSTDKEIFVQRNS